MGFTCQSISSAVVIAILFLGSGARHEIYNNPLDRNLNCSLCQTDNRT